MVSFVGAWAAAAVGSGAWSASGVHGWICGGVVCLVQTHPRSPRCKSRASVLGPCWGQCGCGGTCCKSWWVGAHIALQRKQTPTIETLGETVNANATRLAHHEEDTRDALTVLDHATDCIRYGLMEFGGFVRNEILSAVRRSHMFTQERANFVLWNMQRNRPEDTDEPAAGPTEGGEEEALTEDEEVQGETEGMSNLMDSWRNDQNVALASELWNDAAQIQRALMTVLDASSTGSPRGMSIDVVNTIMNVVQRLYRTARNRGREDRAQAYRRYVDDLHGVLRHG